MPRRLALALCLVTAFAAGTLAVRAEDGPYLGRCVDDDTVDAAALVQRCTLVLNDSFVQGLYVQYRSTLFYRRGKAYDRMEKYAKAAEDYRAALNLAPGYIEVWKSFAELYGRAGQPDAAMQLLDKMIEVNGATAPMLNAACWVRGMLNRQLAEAMTDCNNALEFLPNDASTLDSRCLVEYRRGEMTAAVTDCSAALKIGPQMPPTYYVRGLAQIALGHADLGKADIDQAKALYPGIATMYGRYGVGP